MFPEKGNMGKVLPEYLSNWTTEKVRKGERTNKGHLFKQLDIGSTNTVCFVAGGVGLPVSMTCLRNLSV